MMTMVIIKNSKQCHTSPVALKCIFFPLRGNFINRVPLREELDRRQYVTLDLVTGIPHRGQGARCKQAGTANIHTVQQATSLTTSCPHGRYADTRRMEVGLLFGCRLGAVDLERPVALLQNKVRYASAHSQHCRWSTARCVWPVWFTCHLTSHAHGLRPCCTSHSVPAFQVEGCETNCLLPCLPACQMEGGETKVEATLMAQQTPAQRQLVGQLQPQAAHAWWTKNHPGWAIFPMDSDTYVQVGRGGRGTTVWGEAGGGRQ